MPPSGLRAPRYGRRIGLGTESASAKLLDTYVPKAEPLSTFPVGLTQLGESIPPLRAGFGACYPAHVASLRAPGRQPRALRFGPFRARIAPAQALEGAQSGNSRG